MEADYLAGVPKLHADSERTKFADRVNGAACFVVSFSLIHPVEQSFAEVVPGAGVTGLASPLVTYPALTAPSVYPSGTVFYHTIA